MVRRSGRKRKRAVTLAEPKEVVIDNRIPSLLHNAIVTTIEVDNPDPEQVGDKIVAYRTLRRDPLAWMHAHKHINDAQYQAGRAWQRDWETVEQGARAIDPTKEAVDGGRLAEPLSDRRLKASDSLAGVAGLFSTRPDDKRILHAFLALGMGIEQIGLVYFGRYGAGYVRRLSERLKGILEELAVFYGYAMRVRG